MKINAPHILPLPNPYAPRPASASVEQDARNTAPPAEPTAASRAVTGAELYRGAEGDRAARGWRPATSTEGGPAYRALNAYQETAALPDPASGELIRFDAYA